jgi:hypothetical protein
MSIRIISARPGFFGIEVEFACPKGIGTFTLSDSGCVTAYGGRAWITDGVLGAVVREPVGVGVDHLRLRPDLIAEVRRLA